MAALDLETAEAAKVAGNLSSKLPWDLANPKWAAAINPVLSNPLVTGQILSGIKLASGANTISHGLGRKLQGYLVILNSASTTFYDKQSTNQMPDLTLQIVSSGATIVSLYVF